MCAAAQTIETSKKCTWQNDQCRQLQCEDVKEKPDEHCQNHGKICIGPNYDCSIFSGSQNYCLEGCNGQPCIYIERTCYPYINCTDVSFLLQICVKILDCSCCRLQGCYFKLILIVRLLSMLRIVLVQVMEQNVWQDKFVLIILDQNQPVQQDQMVFNVIMDINQVKKRYLIMQTITLEYQDIARTTNDQYLRQIRNLVYQMIQLVLIQQDQMQMMLLKYKQLRLYLKLEQCQIGVFILYHLMKYLHSKFRNMFQFYLQTY